MCEELDKELQCGQDAAEKLVQHVEMMGMADKMTRTVKTSRGCYIVEVVRTS